MLTRYSSLFKRLLRHITLVGSAVIGCDTALLVSLSGRSFDIVQRLDDCTVCILSLNPNFWFRFACFLILVISESSDTTLADFEKYAASRSTPLSASRLKHLHHISRGTMQIYLLCS